MLSAGLCQQIGAALNIDMNPSLKEVLTEGKVKPVFTDFLHPQALKSGVNASLNIAIGGQPAQEVLKTAARDVALNSVASWASYKVGDAGFQGKMTPNEQDLAHTGIGALFGMATHLDKPLEGAITGSHLKALLAIIFKGSEVETDASAGINTTTTHRVEKGLCSSSETTSSSQSTNLYPTLLQALEIHTDTKKKATY